MTKPVAGCFDNSLGGLVQCPGAKQSGRHLGAVPMLLYAYGIGSSRQSEDV